MKKIFTLFALFLFFSIFSDVSAHVVVTPSEAGIASYQNFDMGVPAEKNLPTVGLKLILPADLNDVTPNVKEGWQVHIVKETKDTAIEWYGGSISPGERDDFYFSAQVPATSTTLLWKAYQTYSDGSIVSWDQDPAQKMNSNSSNMGPYSQTSIVNDLTASSSTSTKTETNTSLTISLIALVISVIAFVSARKGEEKPV